jgi:hypothetical protein
VDRNREARGGLETVQCRAPLTPDLPYSTVQVKMAYVNFVNHCYVDTEVEMKEIYTSNHIWTLFENFTLDMARVCPCGAKGRAGAGSLVGVEDPHVDPCIPSFLQVCSKREKRVADPTLEKYVLTVVLDTISAFFSSPFSENSTSLQVGFLHDLAAFVGSGVGKGEKEHRVLLAHSA